MKSLFRVALTIALVALLMVLGGLLWIKRTLYPKPLPANPWEVPAIKMPGGLPTGEQTITPQKQKR